MLLLDGMGDTVIPYLSSSTTSSLKLEFSEDFWDDGTRLFEVSPHNFLNLPKWYRDFKRRKTRKEDVLFFLLLWFQVDWVKPSPKFRWGVFFPYTPEN